MNTTTKQPSKKLDYHQLGPFAITKKISSHAYCLGLSQALDGIHNVFHVKLLEPFNPDPFTSHTQPPPPPIEIKGNKEYKVSAVLNSCLQQNKVQYLVQWLGWEHTD